MAPTIYCRGFFLYLCYVQIMKHTYNVLGVMSGTSIDGIDLCYCSFTIDKVWSYRIIKCETVVYDAYWVNKLSQAISLSKSEIPILNNEYTSYLALVINNFIEKLNNA